MPRHVTSISRLWSRFADLRRDAEGSTSILVGFAMLPIIGLLGLGIDYGMAAARKKRLDSAADAAALAAMVTAKAYLAEHAGESDASDRAKAEGEAQAAKVFSMNAGGSTYGTATPSVTRSGQTLVSSVTYTATVNTVFGRLFNVPSTSIINTVTASTDLASYLDFYLMVDVSGSMGLPSTDQGMTALAKVNTDNADDYKQGCQFACHFPGYVGWSKAAGKIQLRSDAVNNAVCALLTRSLSPAVPNQYRIGIYPFINQLATLADLTDSVSSALTLKAATQCQQTWPLAFTNLLDTGKTQLYSGSDPTTGTGSGGTHFEVAMPQMKAAIKSFGDGSALGKSKPYVFLITDGMQNSQHYFDSNFKNKRGKYAYPGNPSSFTGYSNAWWDGSQPAQIDATQCDDLKKSGVTVSILYIPYNIIKFVNNNGGIAWENNRVNSFSPTLATPLRNCASPGFFYTANTPEDITASLNAMFDQALKATRLTQ